MALYSNQELNCVVVCLRVACSSSFVNTTNTPYSSYSMMLVQLRDLYNIYTYITSNIRHWQW